MHHPPNAQPNHLVNETSRYLVESAYDPVNWYPWGQQAFEAARRTQKPILLSSGFLSCHMCNVMSSHFKEPQLAAVLNDKFICIKVDREERPDVDSVYNAFVQAITGRTGWPLTCFLTPALVPFVGTTYLTSPRLKEAVSSIAERWENSRAQVESDGVKVIGALRDLFSKDANGPRKEIGLRTLRRAFKTAESSFDVEHGGFGSAPKFPRPSVLDFLLSLHNLSGEDARLRSESLNMALDTLKEIASGGLHDHIGGGFFRYSLDAAWHVPHFEKILADQAQLAHSFLNAYLITKDRLFKDVACRTLDFMLSEMRDPQSGAFYSAIHADSESLYDVSTETAEGAFYTFSSFELKLILGEPANTIFCKRYGVETAGNVRNEAVARSEYDGLEGLNIFRISSTIAEISSETGLSQQQVQETLDDAVKKVFAERQRRPAPPVDDMTITCWHALAISAFARAGSALERPDYTKAAVDAASLMLEDMVIRADSSADALYLARAYRRRRGKVEAFAEDYANAIQALLDCFEATCDARYLVFARRLQNALDLNFFENDGYSNSMKGDNDILLRRKEDYDGSEPCASSVATLNLVRMSAMLGDESLREKAQRISSSFSQVLEKSPLAMPMLLVAVEAMVSSGPTKAVIMGDNDEASELLREFWSRGLPRSTALLRLPRRTVSDMLKPYLDETRQRILNNTGSVVGFMCEGNKCFEPTTDVQRFREQLDDLGFSC